MSSLRLSTNRWMLGETVSQWRVEQQSKVLCTCSTQRAFSIRLFRRLVRSCSLYTALRPVHVRPDFQCHSQYTNVSWAFKGSSLKCLYYSLLAEHLIFYSIKAVMGRRRISRWTLTAVVHRTGEYATEWIVLCVNAGLAWFLSQRSYFALHFVLNCLSSTISF